MLALPVAYYLLFRYVPMVGNVLAFRRYRPGKGMFGVEWTLIYFKRFLGVSYLTHSLLAPTLVDVE